MQLHCAIIQVRTNTHTQTHTHTNTCTHTHAHTPPSHPGSPATLHICRQQWNPWYHSGSCDLQKTAQRARTCKIWAPDTDSRHDPCYCLEHAEHYLSSLHNRMFQPFSQPLSCNREWGLLVNGIQDGRICHTHLNTMGAKKFHWALVMKWYVLISIYYID